ncbi:MAG: sulfatase-like hydrolase/transferase, partial [Thermocrispum sp.]
MPTRAGATARPSAVPAAPRPQPLAGRPNIVLILADDLGFSDLGAFGSEISTPHLDALAAGGRRLTGLRSNARCCPSRASLLTGLYPTQAGVGHMDRDEGHPAYQGFLRQDARTVAQALRDVGYRTSLSGKWHLGSFDNASMPVSRGFERSWGPVRGWGSYYRPPLYRDGREIGTPDDPGFYLTDAIADHAVDTIRTFAHGSRPFFSFVSFTAPHWPLHARAEDIAPYRDRYRGGWDRIRAERFERQRELGLLPGVDRLPPRTAGVRRWREAHHHGWQASRMATYAAQVTALDRAVGRIVRTLDELDRLPETAGIRERTLIVFLSDNGGCAEWLPERFGRGFTDLRGRPVRAGNHPARRPGPAGTFASYGPGWA